MDYIHIVQQGLPTPTVSVVPARGESRFSNGSRDYLDLGFAEATTFWKTIHMCFAGRLSPKDTEIREKFNDNPPLNPSGLFHASCREFIIPICPEPDPEAAIQEPRLDSVSSTE